MTTQPPHPPFDVEAARTILKDAIWKAIDPSLEGVARRACEKAIKALTDNLPAALAAGAARVVAERDAEVERLHAELHGYRQKLVEALAAMEADNG